MTFLVPHFRRGPTFFLILEFSSFFEIWQMHTSHVPHCAVWRRPALHTCARTAIMWHVITPAVAGVPQETRIQGMLQRVLGLRYCSGVIARQGYNEDAGRAGPAMSLIMCACGVYKS